MPPYSTKRHSYDDNCGENSSSIQKQTIKSNPELFKYSIGDTVYFVFTSCHNYSQIFSGVIINGEISDDGIVSYTVNNANRFENDLFSSYNEANAKLLMSQSIDFKDELNDLLNRVQYRVQVLADVIYGKYTSIIDIPEETRCICNATAHNGNIEHSIDVFKVNQLHIKYDIKNECFNFYYCKVNSCDTVSVDELMTADTEYIRIVDYLERYIKEYVLDEEIDDDYED